MGLSAAEAEARWLAPVYAQLALEPLSAAGVNIRCGDRELIDFYGGHAVAGLGYGHPRLAEAIAHQARALTFQSNAVPVAVRARAAERLVRFAPAPLERAFLVNSGAEANENALRIACRLTGRDKIVALEHGFHGRTAAAGAVTWGAREQWYGFPRAPFEVSFVARDDPQAAAAAIDRDTAAVILEPVQGIAGAYPLTTEFLAAVVAACRGSGALLIADEVQCGMGRCGKPFAVELHGVGPDLLTTAKALGGGFPCGALLMTADIAGSLHPGDLGTTFGGGPLACAAIETVIDVIESERLLDNVRALSAYICDTCTVGPVDSIQGAGFLLGLRCRQPARTVRDGLLERGLLVGTSADPDIVRLLPPYVLRRQHVDRLATALAELEDETT